MLSFELAGGEAAVEAFVAGLECFTLAESLAVASAALVAVTVIVVPDGIVDGAVYCPLAEIVPVCAPPPGTPSTLQLTAVFVAPVTLA